MPVLLVGLTAPSNYGPDDKRDFEAMYPDLAEEYGALLVTDFLAPVTAALDAGAAQETLVQPDGIHPSAKGVALMVEAIGPRVLELIDRVDAGA